MAGQPSASRTGETLEARYRLDQQLVDDGPAEVYAATDTRQGHPVVIQLLRPELALQRGAVEGFVVLPKALLSAQPPHVARVLAVTSDDTGIPFVVEEASSGQALAERLAVEPDGLPLHEAARLVAPVVEAVARMHLAGVVHGRLEPSRIVVMPFSGQTTSRIVHHSAALSEVRVRSAYQAPEQRGASPPFEPAVDVWALGVLIHHALSGRLPVADPSVAQLEQALPDVPPAIVSAVHECLRSDPAQRLLDAAVLWMRVEGVLAQAAKAPVPPQVIELEQDSEPEPEGEPDTGTEADLDPPPVAAEPTNVPIAAVAHAFAPLEADLATGSAVAPQAATQVRPIPAAANQDKGSPPVAGVRRARPVELSLTEAAPQTKGFPVAATQRARAAGALSDAQMRSVLALDKEREHRLWPWVRVVLLLLLLLLLYKAIPFLTEPDLLAARRVFGPKLEIVGIALGVVMVAALATAWAVSVTGNALVVRPMVYSFQVVALCILVLVGGSLWFGFGDPSLYGGAGAARAGGAAWRVAGGFARMVLPYGAALLMWFGALYGLMQGLTLLRDATALAIAALLLALGGGGAGFSIAVNTIKPDLQKRIEDAKNNKRRDDGPPDVNQIKRALSHKPIDVNAAHEPSQSGDQPELRQRTSIGDGDDETLILEDMKRQRSHQHDVIKAADKELPTIPRH